VLVVVFACVAADVDGVLLVIPPFVAGVVAVVGDAVVVVVAGHPSVRKSSFMAELN
jgi:hypothetical protein